MPSPRQDVQGVTMFIYTASDIVGLVLVVLITVVFVAVKLLDR